MELDARAAVKQVQEGPARDEITVHCAPAFSLPHPGDELVWEGQRYVMTSVLTLGPEGAVVVFRQA